MRSPVLYAVTKALEADLQRRKKWGDVSING